MGSPERQLTTRAAGAVVWRRDRHDRTEIAIVHRPRYDDWSLPKGKIDRHETSPEAAVREVAEETGQSCVLERFLTTVGYTIPAETGEGTVPKSVNYYSARAAGGTFVPNSEVDELRWMDVAEARRVLSYSTEIGVLDEFTSIPTDSSTLLLVRHAKAGKKENWDGDDDLRPLSNAGLRQAEALANLLPLFGPDRVHSAPRLRCVQTVHRIAEGIGSEVVHEPLLSEEGYTQDPDKGMQRLLELVSGGGTPVVCSQGGVIPDLVSTLAARDGHTLRSTPTKKGSLWVLTFTPHPDGSGPMLRSAHHLPNPLPTPDR
ncbi:NUDIX hydrolase [Haloechinothrix sp. YIM 98757]|uniref:NUDIX hydrolase n=1 Tax=Haloechinothrix aidingensis TaxID=2752311 RepID=A0A838A905_9PSEU|nr:NUDIX hydrolase [Haloechinothrix aidingensis]